MIEAKITRDYRNDMINELGFSLVRVQFSGGQSGRNQLQIMIEPTEDREMTVEDCQMLSRHISVLIDVDDPIASAYNLEVSSRWYQPPLTRIDDFNRFNGELAKVTLRRMRMGVVDFKDGSQACWQTKKWVLKQALAALNLILVRLSQRGLIPVKF